MNKTPLSAICLMLAAPLGLGCGDATRAPVGASVPAVGAAAEDDNADQALAGSVEQAPRRIRPEDLPSPADLTPEDWPQFRGAQRDGVARGATRLARSWPREGPPVVWQTAVGQGYASPAVVGGKVFLNDYDEAGQKWLVRCLSLESGDELWRYEVAKRIRPNHAITRTAPATDGGFVFSIDPKCELHCLDARTGGLIWKKRLPQAYGSPIPAWYNGQCPLLDGGRLVVATGGRALLVALDQATGDPIWESANPDGSPMSHSSVVPVELDGVRQYAYLTLTGLSGVSAETGKVLWNFPWKLNTAVSPSPLPLGGGRFLITSGYHAQSVVCRVTRGEKGWMAEEVTPFAPPPQGWNSEVHTPILHRGFVFGVGKSRRGMWTCLDLDGHELWNSGRKASFGMGGYVLADGLFIALDGASGKLRLIDAAADEYRQLAEAELLEGPDVWAPPVVSQGRLLIRDLQKLLCVDLAEHQPPLAAATQGAP